MNALSRSHDVEAIGQPCHEGEHPFSGRHLVVQYLGCDVTALEDHEGLLRAMREAVVASGATLLKMSEHPFEGGGLTAVMLLSESHASIHTYPEFGACFVDLFTCGHNCRAEDFDAVLRAYLRPRDASAKVLLRSQGLVAEEGAEK